MKLTGHWQGHYEQDGARHGISMHVVQTGASLRGRMLDEDTLMMGGIEPDDADELRQILSVDDAVEPEVITSLPSDSTILGEVEEDTISFVKVYHGSQTSQLWIDDVHVQFEIPGHRVHYEGTLDESGDVLRGEWHIAAIGEAETVDEAGDAVGIVDDDVVFQADGGDDIDGDDDGELFPETRGSFELRRVVA